MKLTDFKLKVKNKEYDIFKEVNTNVFQVVDEDTIPDYDNETYYFMDKEFDDLWLVTSFAQDIVNYGLDAYKASLKLECDIEDVLTFINEDLLENWLFENIPLSMRYFMRHHNYIQYVIDNYGYVDETGYIYVNEKIRDNPND